MNEIDLIHSITTGGAIVVLFLWVRSLLEQVKELNAEIKRLNSVLIDRVPALGDTE